jgi:hypothetical protein
MLGRSIPRFNPLGAKSAFNMATYTITATPQYLFMDSVLYRAMQRQSVSLLALNVQLVEKKVRIRTRTLGALYTAGKSPSYDHRHRSNAHRSPSLEFSLSLPLNSG